MADKECPTGCFASAKNFLLFYLEIVSVNAIISNRKVTGFIANRVGKQWENKEPAMIAHKLGSVNRLNPASPGRTKSTHIHLSAPAEAALQDLSPTDERYTTTISMRDDDSGLTATSRMRSVKIVRMTTEETAGWQNAECGSDLFLG